MAARVPRQFVLVPFVREKSRHITIEATLCGRPVRFVVDTGASGTVIDTAAIPRFKLGLSGASRKGGGVGSAAMRISYVAGHDLQIGAIDLSATKLIALDLSHVNHGLARNKVRPVLGILGGDVLWHRHAVIDYAKSVMLLSR